MRRDGAPAVILATRYPAAILAPAVMLLGGALGLGAAERVLAGRAVGGRCGRDAGDGGPYRQWHLRDRRRLGRSPSLLAVGGAVPVVALVQCRSSAGAWTIPGSEPVATPDTTTLPATRHVRADDGPPVTPVTPVEVERPDALVSWLVAALLILLLLLSCSCCS